MISFVFSKAASIKQRANTIHLAIHTRHFVLQSVQQTKTLKRGLFSIMTLEDPTILKQISASKCHDGIQYVYEHTSNELKCQMKFAAYVPKTDDNSKLTFLIWLSGLTCNEQNFITKSGFHRLAQKHKICVIAPDTSPRGCNIEGETDRWDFGAGAGFYVDATEEKWKNNYRMYSYINSELHDVIRKNFNKDSSDMRVGIFGHSMGGHGALVSFLKNPGKYKSVSAFAPICNPVNCDWGKFAFNGYLGANAETWKEYDSCCLLKSYKGPACSILVDQGNEDQFLKVNQLLPENLVAAGKENSLVDVKMRYHEGYDHSYYFITSFIEDHMDFHAKNLNA